ncbi:MAG: P27 family phage terminase small subunit, partial [Stellaceae bacterium]
MRGRKPKPEGLAELHGNPGKRAPRGGPRVAVQAPTPPAHLQAAGGPALEEWNRVAPILVAMRVLSLADRAALAVYCSAYARWVKAEQE